MKKICPYAEQALAGLIEDGMALAVGGFVHVVFPKR